MANEADLIVGLIADLERSVAQAGAIASKLSGVLNGLEQAKTVATRLARIDADRQLLDQDRATVERLRADLQAKIDRVENLHKVLQVQTAA